MQWLSLIPFASNNSNSISTRLQTVYWLPEHLAPKVNKGACAVCFNLLPEIPPQRAKLYSLMFRVRFLRNELFVQLDYVFEVKVFFVHTPWCGQVVHAHCWADKRVCAAGYTGLVPLPCVVRNRPLECWGGDTLEKHTFSAKSSGFYVVKPMYIGSVGCSS